MGLVPLIKGIPQISLAPSIWGYLGSIWGHKKKSGTWRASLTWPGWHSDLGLCFVKNHLKIYESPLNILAWTVLAGPPFALMGTYPGQCSSSHGSDIGGLAPRPLKLPHCGFLLFPHISAFATGSQWIHVEWWDVGSVSSTDWIMENGGLSPLALGAGEIKDNRAAYRHLLPPGTFPVSAHLHALPWAGFTGSSWICSCVMLVFREPCPWLSLSCP